MIGYQYNQDQLSALSINGQTYLSGLRYNAAQQITRWQWADGSANQQVYDSLNRLQRFQLGKDTRTLSYDAVSNVIGFEDQGTNPQSQRFGYDTLDRIISYQAANDAQMFEYDPNGNRTAKRQQNSLIPYLIEANSNRLMGVGNAAQQLDANGNLLNDGKFLYTYNAQNRLANVDGIYRYTYNANQQRVQKTTPQGTTLYAWADGRIIGEYDQSGTAKQETVYMGTTPIATIQQGKVYRIYADQLDTPRVITDENGKTLWRWDSSPFGETAANEDADGDGIALNYNPRFPGQLYDAETGLHYNYHRDYNPETGRYVQSDPIGLAGGLNTFGYAGQNPYGYVDPDGMNRLNYRGSSPYPRASFGNPWGIPPLGTPVNTRDIYRPQFTPEWLYRPLQQVQQGGNICRPILEEVLDGIVPEGIVKWVKVNVTDPAADALARRLGGISSVKFPGRFNDREFDVFSNEFIGQTKPANFKMGSAFRNQAKGTFEAAIELGRKPLFHFNGSPDPAVIKKLNEYGRRFGIDPIIDTSPL